MNPLWLMFGVGLLALIALVGLDGLFELGIFVAFLFAIGMSFGREQKSRKPKGDGGSPLDDHKPERGASPSPPAPEHLGKLPESASTFLVKLDKTIRDFDLTKVDNFPELKRAQRLLAEDVSYVTQ